MSGLGEERSASKGGGLTVSTLLALVAAVGVGLAVTRTLPDFLYLHEERSIVNQYYPSATGGSWQSYPLGRGNLFGRPSLASWRRPSYWLDHVPYWSGPCLVSLTFAATVLGMRRPRPRRVDRLPGMVVGIAVLVAMTVKFAECLSLLAIWWHSMAAFWKPTWPWSNAVNGPWAYFWLTLPGPAAFGVVVGWLALALRGRRTAAPDSGEWLGRAMGWSWIALASSRAIGTLCLALDQ